MSLEEMSLQEMEAALLIIREYENSIDRPEAERHVVIDSNGFLLPKGPFVAYAQKCMEYLRFGEEVDQALAMPLERSQQQRYDLKICNTPTIFFEAGFDQKPLLYKRTHLLLALASKSKRNSHRHGLTIEQIKRLPELFETPAILANSPRHDESLLAVLPEVDPDGVPLIAAIRPDGHGNYELEEIESNFVTSVYGKDNFRHYFASVKSAGIVYINKEKAQELERIVKLRLLHDYSSSELDNILQLPKCIVNLKNLAPEPRPEYDVTFCVTRQRFNLEYIEGEVNDRPVSDVEQSPEFASLNEARLWMRSNALEDEISVLSNPADDIHVVQRDVFELHAYVYNFAGEIVPCTYDGRCYKTVDEASPIEKLDVLDMYPTVKHAWDKALTKNVDFGRTLAHALEHELGENWRNVIPLAWTAKDSRGVYHNVVGCRALGSEPKDRVATTTAAGVMNEAKLAHEQQVANKPQTKEQRKGISR